MIPNPTSMVSVSNIKRVVSVFILRPIDNNPRSINCDVAVFRRCSTMPTFANHWAGISGSIEEDDRSPLDAAVRELREETNVVDIFMDYIRRNDDDKQFNGLLGDKSRDETQHMRFYLKAGLYIDISKKNSRGAFGGRIIRVYPFALKLPIQSSSLGIEMRGTEHDQMKFVSVQEFLDLTPCVPGLQKAFHQATVGSHLVVSE